MALETARAGRLWELALICILLTLAGISWLATAWLAMPGMHPTLLKATPTTDTGGLSLADAGMFLAMWIVMMAAMMLPAIGPVVVAFDRWVRRSGRSRWHTALFLGGYLAVWSGVGVIAFGLLEGLRAVLPRGEAAVRTAALVLALAGAYELTPVKEVCLRQCRSPLAFMAAHADALSRAGFAGTRAGAANGLFCLGCCWLLMIVLLLLGSTSLTWMAAIASLIFAEKVLPAHWPVSCLVGLGLLASALLLAISPLPLPVLP